MTPATFTGKRVFSLVERLEHRRLFAVAVAENFPGYYEIDAGAGAGSVAVSVNQDAQTFSLDGTTYQNVQHIIIHGNDDGDTITVNSDSVWGFIGCEVYGGAGNDAITVNGLSGVIHGGGGQDTLTLQDSFYGEVYGDNGSGKINVIGDSACAEIVAGSGGYVVDATRSNYGVTIQGGMGDDTIYGSAYDDEICGGGGNDVLYGTGGNDTFYSTGGVVVGSANGTNTAYVPTGTYVQLYNTQFVYSY